MTRLLWCSRGPYTKPSKQPQLQDFTCGVTLSPQHRRVHPVYVHGYGSAARNKLDGQCYRNPAEKNKGRRQTNDAKGNNKKHSGWSGLGVFFFQKQPAFGDNLVHWNIMVIERQILLLYLAVEPKADERDLPPELLEKNIIVAFAAP